MDGELVWSSDGCCGPDPLTVFSADREPFHLVDIDCAEGAAEGVEGDNRLVTVNGELLELRAAVREFETVVFGEGKAGKALGYITLVFRVDVVGFAKVDDDGLATIWNGVLSFGLAFAKLGPVTVTRGGRLRLEIS